MTLILPGDLDDQQVIALLAVHRNSLLIVPSHAVGLRAPDITFWAAWDADAQPERLLLGVGALRALTPVHGEVISMHTAKVARRRGVGTSLLRHIISVARERGYSRLSLETGTREAFNPARALYGAHGFVECGPFGDYQPDPLSVFMTMELR